MGGLKGKLQNLALTLQGQNEEIGVEKNQLETIKSENISTWNSLQAQLNDIKRYFQADLQRMEEEFRVQVNLQKSENARLQQQLTTLKGEKTSIHQQIIALQRRIEEIEEEIGHHPAAFAPHPIQWLSTSCAERCSKIFSAGGSSFFPTLSTFPDRGTRQIKAKFFEGRTSLTLPEGNPVCWV